MSPLGRIFAAVAMLVSNIEDSVEVEEARVSDGAIVLMGC